MRVEGGPWLWLQLEESGLPANFVGIGSVIRAAGHRERRIEAGALEVELEPDAQLRLRGDPERVRRLALNWEHDGAFQRALVAPGHALGGEVEPGCFVLAVDNESLHRTWGGRVEFSDVSEGCGSTKLTWWPWSGSRCESVIPELPASPELADLEVRILGSDGGSPNAYEGEFTLHDQRHRTEAEDEGHRCVQIEQRPHARVERFSGNLDRLSFPDVPLGARVYIRIRVGGTGASIEHLDTFQGQGIELRLRPGLGVRGRLIPEMGGGLPGAVDVRWRWQQVLTESGSTGRFRLDLRPEDRLLGEIISRTGAFQWPIPMPTGESEFGWRLTLWVSATGYFPVELDHWVRGEHLVDLGEVPIHRHVPEFVLDPGHGLEPGRISGGWVDVDGDGGHVEFEVGTAVVGPRGELQLYLDDIDLEGPGTTYLAWPRSGGGSTQNHVELDPREVAVLVLRESIHGGDGSRSFWVRGRGGGFLPLEGRNWDVCVEVDPMDEDEAPWILEWEFQGLRQHVQTVRPDLSDEPIRLHFEAPAVGARLSWRRSEPGLEGPIGGLMLEQVDGPVRIPGP